MSAYPQALAEVVADFATVTDRTERIELLIETADRFAASRVPASIAVKPYEESHRVPACESEAFVWAVTHPAGGLKFYFDVLNPQGLSAMAMCVILDETCSGKPLEQVAELDTGIVQTLFGRDVSMGKGLGLTGIINFVRHLAQEGLKDGG